MRMKYMKRRLKQNAHSQASLAAKKPVKSNKYLSPVFFLVAMSLRAIKGVLKVFLGVTKEDWQEMDKKFYRVVFGVTGFVLMALFWFYFLRNILPSPLGF